MVIQVQLHMAAAGYTNAVPTDINDTVTGSISGATGYMMGYDNTTRIWTVTMISTALFGVGDVCTCAPGGTGIGTVMAPAIDVYITDKNGNNVIYLVCQAWRERINRPITSAAMATPPGTSGLTGSWGLDLGRLTDIVELTVVFQGMDDYFAFRGKLLGAWSKSHPNKLHIGSHSWDGLLNLSFVTSDMEKGEDTLIVGTLEFYVGSLNGNIDW